jgi:hypothetical protein
VPGYIGVFGGFHKDAAATRVNQEATYLTNIIRPATITKKYSAAATKIRRPLARLKSSALCSALRTPICPATRMENVSLSDNGAGAGSDSGGLVSGFLIMANFAQSDV